MGFHEVRFPASLSFGSLGGPERLTDIVTLANGFFEARRGQLFGFRWKDWTDFKSGRAKAAPDYRDQEIGVGDDATVAFPLLKSYRSGDQVAVRPIVKPVKGTVRMGLDNVEMQEGVHYEVDTFTGVVTFSEPPNRGVPITAGYEFDVPVRFDTDRIQTSLASFQAGEVPNVPVVEIRV